MSWCGKFWHAISAYHDTFNKRFSILGSISRSCRKGGAFHSVSTRAAAVSLPQAHSHCVGCIWPPVSLETSLCRAKGITSSFPTPMSHLEIWQELSQGFPTCLGPFSDWGLPCPGQLYVIGTAQILHSWVVCKDSKPLWKGLTASVHHRQVALGIMEFN